ncbi:hypothetical protein [Estrella lausannensis]|uniref:Uncharacterized protein n=1 Tax=Estrella lausannensis TaxID=483423 RepID=A0A0H5DRA4_9BACT|nr:hypothetical protein [Estrella lausannensis]CRX39102.1 hypothetical protein ELAC_1776 [Estrella lausannensis]
MDNLQFQEKSSAHFLQSIFPAAIASCAKIVEPSEKKITVIATAQLFQGKPQAASPLESLKEKFMATTIGKMLLNPFGYSEISLETKE